MSGAPREAVGEAHVLPSGPLSQVYGLSGPLGDVVVKLAAPDVTAREAVALRDPPGDATVPEVLAQGEGVLVLSLLPGEHVPPAELGAAELLALGAQLRRIHESRRTPWGQWPQWEAAERSLDGYRGQVEALVRAMAEPAQAERVERVLAALPALPPADDPPFRRLHGDLWSGNLLWHRGEPALLDWEYSRQGDAAEELAYLIEMDDLRPDQVTALTAAYGSPTVTARVATWRPLVALSAGLWYAELGLHGRAEALLRQAERG